MESLYLKNLKSAVLKYSDSSNWNAAVYEWEIYDVDEDDTLSESCVCGKENLRYLFTIKNKINGNILYPIGSSCIHKFERKELNDLATIKEQLITLSVRFLFPMIIPSFISIFVAVRILKN